MPYEIDSYKHWPVQQFVVTVVITTAITSVLLVSCAPLSQSPSQSPSQPPRKAPNSSEVVRPINTSNTVNPTLEDNTLMSDATLSPELQQAIFNAVSAEQKVPAGQLEITTTEAADWPDACLGLGGPDEMCAQMMTAGWAVTVTDGQQTWQYRTDLDGLQIKLDAG